MATSRREARAFDPLRNIKGIDTSAAVNPAVAASCGRPCRLATRLGVADAIVRRKGLPGARRVSHTLEASHFSRGWRCRSGQKAELDCNAVGALGR